jgi:hypothetical protein
VEARAMSDRAGWLEKRCPECGAAPGARCGRWIWGRRGTGGRVAPIAHLHVARGWLERPCPTCKAPSGEPCSTPTGREAARVHTARLRPARWELVRRSAVWEELERRGATAAVVPFWGRAGAGGRTDTIKLWRLEGEELVEVERWTYRDELCHALEAPVWERYGRFAGHPLIRAEVIWTADDRCVVIRGRRGGKAFEELAG